ncbi:hypothetical protein F4561_004175 [Lipingzhangella halophila]|uniref:Uncharacterized protein n=1 Tax=Lipingzhangella halophila TaxID=1783352 RepID=A0A7W7RJZ1_9ACTN|nr:hypothetical protein [Lipingzhangella halophila]
MPTAPSPCRGIPPPRWPTMRPPHRHKEERTVQDIAREGWDRTWIGRTLRENGCDHA